MDVKFDMVQIFRKVFDHASNALKVKLASTEIAIELDHTDGDSVTSHPAKLTASCVGASLADVDAEVIPALDCSSIRRLSVKIDGTGTVKVLVSPCDSGNFFYEVPSEVENLCCRRVKVVSVDLEGDVHLVGRS